MVNSMEVEARQGFVVVPSRQTGTRCGPAPAPVVLAGRPEEPGAGHLFAAL